MVEQQVEVFKEEVIAHEKKKEHLERINEEHHVLASKVEDVMRVKGEIEAPCNWISWDWLCGWYEGSFEVEMKAIDNSFLSCRHGKLRFDCMKEMKRISPEAWQILHDRYGGGPQLDQNSYCVECVQEVTRKMHCEVDKRRKLLELLEEEFSSWEGKRENQLPDHFYLSRKWFTLFKKGQDEWCSNINESITCTHGELEMSILKRRAFGVSEKCWKYLINF
eukprot:TRINITY_DN8417_c0_g1_i1.p1 TRINITY_DN8417_c0_g1~~TRINITY_DN8417_c0_g1_i1.p1  ORF type:complete len:221 (+),score=56.55 TRINITY_DN8417_c0_g1_i1:436-1098(+)